MADQERVMVDDALISTDVDRLIRIISNKRIMDISELQKSTGIERKTIDKWLKVLEDEGYVRMDYRITNTHIIWSGEEKGREEEITVQETSKDDTHSQHTEISEKQVETILQQGTGADSLISTVEQPVQESIDEELEQNIIEKIEENEVATENQAEKVEITDTEPITELQIVQKHKIEEANGQARKEEKAKIRRVVSSYLDEIGRQKTEIGELRHQKETLYRERYTEIESRVEAELATVTEKILEKEGRILELKERVLELPDKVEELEKMNETMNKVEQDGKEVIKRTRAKVENLIEELKKSEELVRTSVGQTRISIDAQQKKLDDVSNIEQALDTRMEKIKETLNGTSTKLQEMTETMQSMFEELQDASRMKTEVAEIANNLRGSMDQREEELLSLEDELSDIRKVEEWVKEYLKDYEQKISEVEEYVRTSDDEMGKLREAAEKEYIKRYVHELQSLTHLYEREMEGVGRDEKEIDKKIAESKNRLANLVSESKIMLSKLMKETADVEDFSSAHLNARTKITTVRNIIEEKEKERDRLSEDAKAAKEKRKKKESKNKKGKK